MKYFFLKWWKFLYRSGLGFKSFCFIKLALHKRIGCKSEFGFEHKAAKRRFVAKRMPELLRPILLWRTHPHFSRKSQNSNRTSIKKERAFLTTILLITTSLCYGCLSPPTSPKAKPIPIDKTTLELSSDGKTLQGTGRVLFDQPLFGLYSRELYFVKAEFLHPHSSFILHSHLSDFSKQDGVRVLLHRENNDLNLYVSTPGYKTQKLSTKPDYFLGNQRVALYIKVENGTENLVDVAVWNFYINPRGNLKTPSVLFSRQNQLSFSNNPLFYSKGQGILWGAELNEIRLIEIFRESPNSL